MAKIVIAETKKSLTKTNKKLKEALEGELREDLWKGRLGIESFLTNRDDVYVFTQKGYGEGFRIDCAESKDEKYKKYLIKKEDKAYYLQVQKDKTTYANVCYSSQGCFIEDLVEAICISITSGEAQYVIPE